MKSYVLPIVLEKDEDGYFAYCPLLQGCYTQGDTYEEALKNIKDTVKLHLEDRQEEKEFLLPKPQSISVTTLEVAA